MKLKEKISWLMGRLQRQLFPCLEECCVSPLTEREKHLVRILELIKVESHTAFSRQWMGRPPAERKAIARCFVAKAVLRYQHTRSLLHGLQARPNLRRICGFARKSDIPSEATFSRVFAEFAANNLGTIVNDALVKEYWSKELVGHISRDSTAIQGRERAAVKVKQAKAPRKRGRPTKGEERTPAELKRLDIQQQQTVSERFNSRLKEEFGGRNVMVRGPGKVMLHLMFGVVSLFADILLKLGA
jgi:hypothetical protein